MSGAQSYVEAAPALQKSSHSLHIRWHRRDRKGDLLPIRPA